MTVPDFNAAAFVANVAAATRDQAATAGTTVASRKAVGPHSCTCGAGNEQGVHFIDGRPCQAIQGAVPQPVIEDVDDIFVPHYTFVTEAMRKCSDCDIPFPAGTVMTRIGVPTRYHVSPPVLCGICYRKRYDDD